MSRSRYRIFETHYPYFMTSTIVGWLPIFTRPEAVNIILESWRFLQAKRGLTIYGYVILENHLHWIACSENLSADVGDSKSFTARQIIDFLQTRGEVSLLEQLSFFCARHKVDQYHQLWQEGSHPEQIQGDEMMRQKLEYTHNNPVRRGYVDDPVHWRYSSARDYAGMPGLIEVCTRW
ncbi:transposase [Planctomycetaceae bacterium SCGC AG-212-D15]|nr:transposase [Planctomycetaceae bacterium SCGC AG-212-D15]